MSNQSFLFGAGGLVLGLLGGVALGTATSQSKISGAIDKRLAPLQAEAAAAAATQQEALAALEEKLAALESGLAETAPDLDALKAELSTDVAAQLDALSTTLRDDLGKSAEAQAEAMKAAMAGMTDSMAEMSDRMENSVSSAMAEMGAMTRDAPEGGGKVPMTAPPTGATAPAESHAVGHTALFADGAVRVFVSAVDAAGGTARVAVNGVAVQTVAVNEPVAVSAGDKTCTLTVTGVGMGMVGLEASCG